MQPDGCAVAQRHHETGPTPPGGPASVVAPGSRPHDPLRIARSIGTEVTQPEYDGDPSSHSARESAKTLAGITGKPANFMRTGQPDRTGQLQCEPAPNLANFSASWPGSMRTDRAGRPQGAALR